MLTEERAQYLLKGYLADGLNAEELNEFLAWVNGETSEQLLKATIDGAFAGNEWPNLANTSRENILYHNVLNKAAGSDERPRTRITPFYSAMRIAAVLLLLLSVTVVVWYAASHKNGKKEVVKAGKEKQPDILPGGNKATLTLDNGSVIVLDTAANGTLAKQGGVKVSKLANGQLLYQVEGKPAGDVPALWQTLATPKGGQYRVVLPDGSTALLNALSTIRFPSFFNGRERNVTVTGEVYFEVTSKQGNQPFIVAVEDKASQHKADVQVLGTEFNIMAYENEGHVAATLLSGAVKVKTAAQKEIQLKPGQQLLLSDKYKTEQVLEGRDEQAVAWVKGYFHFEKSDIKLVMRQLERWYDITVEYESVPVKKFSGTIPRGVNAGQVLKMLELTGNVHFTVNGTHVKVTI